MSDFDPSSPVWVSPQVHQLPPTKLIALAAHSPALQKAPPTRQTCEEG